MKVSRVFPISLKLKSYWWATKNICCNYPNVSVHLTGLLKAKKMDLEGQCNNKIRFISPLIFS